MNLRLLALAALVAACSGGPSRSPAPASPNDVAASGPASEDTVKVPVLPTDPVRGERLAPVTFVVFSDFQCPYCARLDKTLAQLRERYGAELRVVFKHHPLPMHREARLAAEIGQAANALAGADAFWRYNDVVFRDQATMSAESLRAAAIAAGVDARALDEGLANRRWSKKVDDDITLARELGAEGAPASFINGVAVSGAKPFEVFTDVIDVELQKALVLASGGVAKDQVYARLVAINYKPPVDEEAEAAAAEARVVHKVPVGTVPVRGPANALVTVVVFSDFECSFCKRAETTLAAIRQEYGDKVRFAWRDLPLERHRRAEPAAELARAARAQKGDAAFWTVHDLLFEAQPSLDEPDLERIAKTADLDVARAMASVRSQAYERDVAADIALADDADVDVTPCFFVNGHRFEGAQGIDKWRPVLDAEIARAEGFLRGGVAREALYGELLRGGKELATPEKRTLSAPPSGAPFRGAPNGKILVQQVGDFQCPYCARAEASLDALLKAYPGQLKVVWRDKPLAYHDDAALAAEASREAFAQKGSAGFDAMNRLLFANPKALSRAHLDGYARTVGLDLAKFAAALDGHKYQAAIEADGKLTTEAGVSGTPAFFIGPYYVSGAQSYGRFRRVVELAGATPSTKAKVP